MNKLGPYWSVMHRRSEDYDFFKRLNPTVVKIMDGGPPDYAWVRANLPNALVIARDWALSEQHSDMLADPSGTGRRHAQEWAQKVGPLGFDPAKTLVLGLNEPQVWNAGVPGALTAYTVAFCDECKRLGLRAGAMQLGVGWPANTGKDTPPDWSPYAPIEAAIRRGNHALVLHEYWADGGPGEMWGWWAGRSLKCPWDVPIVIGECGIDMFVKNPSVSHHARGWQAHVDANRYAADLREYVGRMAADKRFVGCCVFAADYANSEWQSFDLQPAYNAILSTPFPDFPHSVYIPTVGSGPTTPTQPPQPPTGPTTPPQPPTQPPAPPSGIRALVMPCAGVVTQRWGERPEVYAKYGALGHNGLDIGNALGTPIVAVADGEVAWAGVDQDYGNYLRIWHPAHGFHSFYAHLDSITVQPGRAVQVRQGQQVATMGSTGNSTGPHLHFEVRIGYADGYGQAAYGHSRGRVDPETVFAILGTI